MLRNIVAFAPWNCDECSVEIIGRVIPVACWNMVGDEAAAIEKIIAGLRIDQCVQKLNAATLNHDSALRGKRCLAALLRPKTHPSFVHSRVTDEIRFVGWQKLVRYAGTGPKNDAYVPR